MKDGIKNIANKIEEREITEEMKSSYIDYAMSVIVSRALPDVRDGLKPVHRRILYAMYEDGLRYGGKFRKSANVVGLTLGRYHPHGDIAVYDALVRMAQDFSLRYPLVQGQGNFGCFTKDTKVKLCDGRNLTFGELIKEQREGKRHWGFAFNPNDKKIEVTEIKNPRLTRKNEKIMEVTLDNGEKIRCTLDHRFMMRDGSYKQAEDLKFGDSLMPLYTKFYNGEDKNLKEYEVIYQPVIENWEFIHRLADEWNLKNGIYKRNAGRIRHHKDFNKLNNNPEILGYVYSLLNKYSKVTLKIYEKERYNNCVPKINNALTYFNSFPEILTEARKHNHKVIKTRILRKREDVYDLTTEPWHNFALAAGIFVHNSIDNDPPAAQRYTEVKLSRIGEEMLKDIEKDTADFIDNYDGTRKEPVVLPSPVPQLIINGSMGIAVGMATNIPPHNLGEVCQALIYLIDHPKVTTEDLFQFIKGPDFPTGGEIFDRNVIIEAYSQGKGPILTRGKAEVVEEGNRTKIIITEIPYNVQKSTLLEQIANLVSEKKISGVKDIRDESDKEGMRIVIDLHKEAYPQKILNSLYKFSALQKTFYLNVIALVDGIQPQTLNLPDLLNYFISHRKEVVVRRTKFELEKAKERVHILEGLHKCLAIIDEVIQTIKKSENREDAKRNLMRKFKLSEIQSNAILDTKLSSLAKLERKKIEDELKELKAKIKELTTILEDPQKVKEVIKKELISLKENFGDERRTKVYNQKAGEIAEEDLVPSEETIITLTKGGYIKRINPSQYKIQKRGGKGILGMKVIGEDIVEHFLIANTHDDLLFFVDSGKVFKIPAYEVPESQRVAKGRGLLNFLEISPQEKVLSLFSLGKKDNLERTKYLIMATKNGIIKKVPLDEFKNVRKKGLIAITLKKGDLLRAVQKTTGEDEVLLVSKKGQLIRFKEKEIRPMGRTASGVIGIRLGKGDELVSMGVRRKKEEKKIKEDKSSFCRFANAREEKEKDKKEYLLVVTEHGYGKKTEIKEFKMQKKGGKGIKAAKITEKTGDLVSSKILTAFAEPSVHLTPRSASVREELRSSSASSYASAEEDLIVIYQRGQIIRTEIKLIPVLSRVTQGVKIMKLDKGDRVASANCI